MLKYEVPMQWHAGGSYIMNQRTFALLLTMSDALNRPLWGQLPGGVPGFMLAGSPIVIVSQFPDVQPGATPVAFGDWKAAYTIVNRRATTMLADPYSASFCTLFRFDARGRNTASSRAGAAAASGSDRHARVARRIPPRVLRCLRSCAGCRELACRGGCAKCAAVDGGG